MFISVLQRTEIESKSQPVIESEISRMRLYQSCKERKLKANHNSPETAETIKQFISVLQRTEIESKSQLHLTHTKTMVCLYQSCKERKLKANHNPW